MAIVFPRDFPSCAHFDRVTFTTQFQHATSVTGGGNPNVAELGPPMWRGEWSVRTLTRAQYAEWSAWLRSLRGGLKLFKGRPRYKWPLAYPKGFGGLTVGGSPWGGTGTISLVSAGRDQLTIAGVPLGFKLSVDDYLSFAVGSRQVLHQVIESGTAVGSSITVTVEPTIRPDAQIGATVRFEAPYCDMVLIEPPDLGQEVNKSGRFSFTGLQVLI